MRHHGAIAKPSHKDVANICNSFHVVKDSYSKCDIIMASSPTTSRVILGALFLCTSGDINDLLLNSCAVAFVTYIDDWIVKGLYAWTQNLGEEEDVDLPSHGKTSIRVVMWSAFFVPVIPVMICVGLAHLGLNVLDL